MRFQISFLFLCFLVGGAAGTDTININFAGLLNGFGGGINPNPTPAPTTPPTTPPTATPPPTNPPTTPAPTAPRLVTGDIDYTIDNKVYQGYFAYPESKDLKPAILVVHDANGIDAYEKRRADDWARFGYYGFAADMYGKGIRPTVAAERSGNISAVLGDRLRLRDFMKKTLDFVKTLSVDSSRMAVSGYCLGGTVSIETARGGLDIQAAISFHGALQTPNPVNSSGVVKAKLLVMSGARDTSVPDAIVNTFQNEMRNASVYYNFISYSDAVHSFTVPSNATTGNAIYNQDADLKSHREARWFLQDVWGK